MAGEFEEQGGTGEGRKALQDGGQRKTFGHPVRRDLSAQTQGPLEYWITRSSAQLRRRVTTSASCLTFASEITAASWRGA
jgi:hypothetical protein